VTDVLIGKVLGSQPATTVTLYKAINWAIEKGAHIISMSLSIDFAEYREQLAKQPGMNPKHATFIAMRTMFETARFYEKYGELLKSGGMGRSALIVSASGNDSDRRGVRFNAGKFTLGAAFPAATPDFVSVGAVGPSGDAAGAYQIADFSNAGAILAGPGVDVVSSVPGGKLGAQSGTSMATPHIAGVAALWAQKLLPTGAGFSAAKVLKELTRSAQRPAGLDEADVGDGIPQAPKS
jgi:subtilisin family serine protease